MDLFHLECPMDEAQQVVSHDEEYLMIGFFSFPEYAIEAVQS